MSGCRHPGGLLCFWRMEVMSCEPCARGSSPNSSFHNPPPHTHTHTQTHTDAHRHTQAHTDTHRHTPRLPVLHVNVPFPMPTLTTAAPGLPLWVFAPWGVCTFEACIPGGGKHIVCVFVRGLGGVWVCGRSSWVKARCNWCTLAVQLLLWCLCVQVGIVGLAAQLLLPAPARLGVCAVFKIVSVRPSRACEAVLGVLGGGGGVP